MLLTEKLKSASSESHRRAEQHPFLRQLIAGELSPQVYVGYLLELRTTYAALEKALPRHPELTATANQFDLWRHQKIKADLAYFKSNYEIEIESHSKCNAYANRLEQLAVEWPSGLISHFYARYLGDLSGGQMLKRFLEKSFNLASEAPSGGVSFYRFDSITSPRDAVIAIKDKLNGLELTNCEILQLEAECVAAFRLSEGMFDAAAIDAPTTASHPAQLSSPA